MAPLSKKEKKKEKRKKEKKKKRKKKKKERKGIMNDVKLLHIHIKCCFFIFFSSPVALKN